jgi:hypothetical protein
MLISHEEAAAIGSDHSSISRGMDATGMAHALLQIATLAKVTGQSHFIIFR